MKSTFNRCVFNVNTGLNPTPMSKLGKQNEKTQKFEIVRNGVIRGGGRNCPGYCPFLGVQLLARGACQIFYKGSTSKHFIPLLETSFDKQRPLFWISQCPFCLRNLHGLRIIAVMGIRVGPATMWGRLSSTKYRLVLANTDLLGKKARRWIKRRLRPSYSP